MDDAMKHGAMRRDGTLEGNARPRLARLEDLSDCRIADGEPDIRGWDVHASDDRKVGRVDGLIADAGAMQVRYLDVKLDRKALRLEEDRHVLLPIGSARLDEHDDEVHLDTLSAAMIAALPSYRLGAITRDSEVRLRQQLGRDDASASDGKADFYGHPHFDQDRFFGTRRRGGERAGYLTRSEEVLDVGTRSVEAGSATVRTSVDTEHVERTVPLMHEEVTVERRPIVEGATPKRGTGKRIAEDEVTVPLMAEEAVVEKRVVPREEIVVRKEAVTEDRTIEADLRKERIEVDRQAERREGREPRR
jgi:uncharacterized protein (TIGR02271 family)